MCSVECLQSYSISIHSSVALKLFQVRLQSIVWSCSDGTGCTQGCIFLLPFPVPMCWQLCQAGMPAQFFPAQTSHSLLQNWAWILTYTFVKALVSKHTFPVGIWPSADEDVLFIAEPRCLSAWSSSGSHPCGVQECALKDLSAWFSAGGSWPQLCREVGVRAVTAPLVLHIQTQTFWELNGAHLESEISVGQQPDWEVSAASCVVLLTQWLCCSAPLEWVSPFPLRKCLLCETPRQSPSPESQSWGARNVSGMYARTFPLWAAVASSAALLACLVSMTPRTVIPAGAVMIHTAPGLPSATVAGDFLFFCS